jgi:Amt family ammonium transporter
LVVVGIVFIERMGVDDPVGAITVHGVCGVWGTISLGLFAAAPWAGGEGLPGAGLFFGGGFAQLGAQIFGTVVACGAAFGAAFVLFTLLKITLGVRVTPEEEIEGLDTSEHGSEAYPTHLHPIHAPSIVGMAGD